MSDLISRQAALEVLDDYAEDIESGNLGIAYSKARTSMCDLPSVEPERKTGKWIRGKDGYIRCDKCGSRGSAIKAHYCHHCGARMEVDG